MASSTNIALLVRAPDRSGALFNVVGCFGGGGGGGVIYPSLIVNKQQTNVSKICKKVVKKKHIDLVVVVNGCYIGHVVVVYL